MEAVKNNSQSSAVGIYDRFDLDTWLRPIWKGSVVYNETVMFLGEDDRAPLLYTPDRIISVRSYELDIEYTEGVDYKLEDGKLVLTEGTRIPVCPLSVYYPEKGQFNILRDGEIVPALYGEGTTMTRWHLAVTYEHSGKWGGIDVASYADRFASFIAKLEAGENVTVFFYGDSITFGANASNTAAPYTPLWAMQFCMYAAKKYGYTVKYITGEREDTVYGTRGTITYINTAVGGWTTEAAIQNFGTHVKPYIEEHGCDLLVLALGMNNVTSEASHFCALLERLAKMFLAITPKADVVLVSTMIPNPNLAKKTPNEWCANGTQAAFEAEMLPLAEKFNAAGTNCAVCPMTSVSRYIHSIKRYRDSSGNNVNHPNDFIVRAYAHAICQTVFGYDEE